MNTTIKSILVFLVFSVSICSYSQEIEIIERNNYALKDTDADAFDFILEDYQIEENEYIATLKGGVTNTKKSLLTDLFNDFWEKANQLGANSYKIKNVEHSSDSVSVEVSVYNLKDTDFDEMVKGYKTNMVYVIGSLDKNKKPKKIKFNKEKLRLSPMKYIPYQNAVDKEAVLSVGGFLGTKIWIKGEKDRLPVFLSLTGFGVGPGNFNQISVSFNTGRIYPIEMNFGQFLIRIMDEN